MGSGSEFEYVQSVLEPGLLIQEVGVSNQAHPHHGVLRRERLVHGVDQRHQVGALGMIFGKFLYEVPGAAQLPVVPFGIVAVLCGPKHPVDQARHQEGGQGQLGTGVALGLTLLPRSS
jgi:hypothetical protein